MAKVNKAVNKGIRILNRTLRTQGSLRKMQNSEDLRVIALGRVLDAALNDLATPDEQASTAPIRSLRRKLEVRKDDLDGVSVGRVAQADSREHMWLMVLFHLLREFKPQNCLELGTCLGISAAYEASSLPPRFIGRSGSSAVIPGRRPS